MSRGLRAGWREDVPIGIGTPDGSGVRIEGQPCLALPGADRDADKTDRKKPTSQLRGRLIAAADRRVKGFGSADQNRRFALYAMCALLEVRNLSVRFCTKLGELLAVDRLSCRLERGEILGIVGESGCGKTVAALSIMRLLDEPGEIIGGQILLDGVDLCSRSERELQAIRGARVAMIFQEPMTAFNPVYTIGQQIAEQIRRHRGLRRSALREKTMDWLARVGIPSPAESYRSYPHELSGGMRQRAMIAMALSCQPDILIADEPTTAVDVTLQGQILALLQDLQAELNMAVLFISHDLGVISEIADRVLVMYAGKVVETASAAMLFAAARHPYTVGLLNSLPQLGRRRARLASIPGAVPALHELPVGCPFQNRCIRVGDDCLQGMPPMVELSTGHSLACYHPEGS